jgi:hypothetical protein
VFIKKCCSIRFNRDTVHYVDSFTTESIAGGMQKVFRDEALRQSLIEEGPARVRPYSKKKSAQERLKVFEEVAG